MNFFTCFQYPFQICDHNSWISVSIVSVLIIPVIKQLVAFKNMDSFIDSERPSKDLLDMTKYNTKKSSSFDVRPCPAGTDEPIKSESAPCPKSVTPAILIKKERKDGPSEPSLIDFISRLNSHMACIRSVAISRDDTCGDADMKRPRKSSGKRTRKVQKLEVPIEC